MADSNDSVGSWPGFIAQLNTTFNIVRDAFGYTLPGAVFLAIGLVCKNSGIAELQSLLVTYKLPSWAAFIAVVAACYAAGNVMAATIYMPLSLAKYIVWMLDRHVLGHVEHPAKAVGATGWSAIPPKLRRKLWSFGF
jgi:hypothetical protein